MAAKLAGWELMPWQRQFVDVFGEILPDGRLAFREADCTIPRQSGKTVVQFAIALDRCINWGSPQRVAYTAQTGWDARRKTIDDIAPTLTRSKLAPFIERVTRGAGNESILFVNGSRIDVLASSEDAGHGRTLDLAILDEAFADSDFRREQAVLPAMATRPDAQMLVFSTAGTEASVFLKRKVEIGRSAVAEGRDSGVAYFEWSADENADPDDEDVWWRVMPALGHTIGIEAVRHARQTMTDGDFRRAYLNQWTVSDERVIPHSAWEAVSGGSVAPRGPGLVLAVDATPDFGMAAIACADREGRGALVAHHEGTGWLLERVVQLSQESDASVVVDRFGPLGFLIGELKARLIPVVEVDTRSYAYSCAAFFTNVMDRKVAIRAHDDLDAAVAAARKRKSGDSWLWARQDMQSDICPLVALTLALGETFKPTSTMEPSVMLV